MLPRTLGKHSPSLHVSTHVAVYALLFLLLLLSLFLSHFLSLSRSFSRSPALFFSLSFYPLTHILAFFLIVLLYGPLSLSLSPSVSSSSIQFFPSLHVNPSVSLPFLTLGSLPDIYHVKSPISVDLFLRKAGPRHHYGNHQSRCVDL